MNKINSAKDIKVGYVVKTRDGDLSMCMEYSREDYVNKILVNENGNWIALDGYDGMSYVGNSGCDIIEVYGLSSYAFSAYAISTQSRPLLYSVAPPTKMTIHEIEDKLGYEIEIVGEHHDR